MPKAKRVLRADGAALTTDLDCWCTEEVATVEVEVTDGTCCDICHERIEDEEKEK